LEAKELRPGNLLKGLRYQGDSWLYWNVKVISVENNSIIVEPTDKRVCCKPDKIEGFEIGLAWIKILGFTGRSRYGIKRLKISALETFDVNGQSVWTIYDNRIKTNIKYVHELQNLISQKSKI
jgi:hypothetical protein